jgi:hypothetical protein
LCLVYMAQYSVDGYPFSMKQDSIVKDCTCF